MTTSRSILGALALAFAVLGVAAGDAGASRHRADRGAGRDRATRGRAPAARPPIAEAASVSATRARPSAPDRAPGRHRAVRPRGRKFELSKVSIGGVRPFDPMEWFTLKRPRGPARARRDLGAIPFGERLGIGGEKEVFAVANDPSRVIGITRTDVGVTFQRLEAEAELLDQLDALGFPVATIDVGTHEGRPAFVQERLVIHSRALDSAAPAQLRATINRATLRDLARIRDTLHRTGTAVLDLQFGIDHAGRIKIADPRNVFRGPAALPLRIYNDLVLRYYERRLRRALRPAPAPRARTRLAPA